MVVTWSTSYSDNSTILLNYNKYLLSITSEAHIETGQFKGSAPFTSTWEEAPDLWHNFIPSGFQELLDINIVKKIEQKWWIN